MRIFVLGLPHTITSPDFSSCAYTMKAWNLCRMMSDLGHEVVHFGNEGSHPPGAEHVTLLPRAEWAAVHCHPGKDFFDISVDSPERKAFHGRFAEVLRERMNERLADGEKTIVCITWGGAQRQAIHGLTGRAIVVESGIGYRHSWANYRVFESYAWLHMTLGAEDIFSGEKWYWPVIPNAFDPAMFTYNDAKEDYFLYLGRIIRSKGVSLAVDLAKRTGRRIILAGQGDPAPYMDSHVEYIGPVGVERRRDLLANASALICPTFYVEPFGGVNVEAQMSGTPVITTDYGAFTETVQHGVTGYRCRTMEQFEFAARHIDCIRPADCRRWAMNYSLERVGLMYDEYFRMLLDLYGDGFYAEHPERAQLNWLSKDFPCSPLTSIEDNVHQWSQAN